MPDVAATYTTALREWLDTSEFSRFVGPTTRQALRDGRPPAATDDENASNGAAMRVAPIGWFTAGDTTQCIESAAAIAAITHTGSGVIGACMIAAAVAIATDGGDLAAVLDGARQAITTAGQIASAPRSTSKMQNAFDQALVTGNIAATATSLHERLDLLSIPTETPACSSVAAVFGILAATSAQPAEAIVLAVNAGDDTHTTAMMTGAIVGAMHGNDAFPEDFATPVVAVNKRLHGIDLTRRSSPLYG